MKKTLLLNASYEVLSFISERKAIKLLMKGKTEVIANWDDDFITWASGSIKHPSVLKLKNLVKINYYNTTNFSRRSVVNRDKSTCQYCSKHLVPSQVTIDHVIPKVQGGTTTFANCVVSCHQCNNKKADRTPEQANMVLLIKPTLPSFGDAHYLNKFQSHWHTEWDNFLKY